MCYIIQVVYNVQSMAELSVDDRIMSKYHNKYSTVKNHHVLFTTDGATIQRRRGRDARVVVNKRKRDDVRETLETLV